MIDQAEANAADTRERLLRAATEAFFADGYRASMDSIAQRAGVAKQTLYNHFAGKDALFGTVVRDSVQTILVSLNEDAEDLRACLIAFALAFRRKVLGEEGIAMYRALTAEAPRFPDLARAVYATGLGETAERLAEFLRKAMAAGKLRQDDPGFAAEMFLSMLPGLERTRSLYGCDTQASMAGDPGKAALIVDCFLRAYARKTASD